MDAPLGKNGNWGMQSDIKKLGWSLKYFKIITVTYDCKFFVQHLQTIFGETLSYD